MPKNNPCKCCHGSGVERDEVKFGRMMREKRYQAEISLRTMAELIGVAPSTLSYMEVGQRKWNDALQAKFNLVIEREQNSDPSK